MTSPSTLSVITLDTSAVDAALQADAVARRIMAKNLFPVKGQRVGVRLNLNVLKNTGVAVQTLHAATNKLGYSKNKGFYNGEAIGYAGAVTLKNAFFNVEQSARDAIACGHGAKSPMASVDGQFVEAPTHISMAEHEPKEVRFNPKAVHLFVDENNAAIRRAEYVTIVGHRAYAWGDIEYHTEATAPKRVGSAPSDAVLSATAKEFTPIAAPSVAPAVATNATVDSPPITAVCRPPYGSSIGMGF